MNARLATLGALVVQLAVACDQQPIGLAVAEDDLPWRTLYSFPPYVTIGSVWGAAEDDVYLIYREAPPIQLLHYDGAEWTPVGAPVSTTSADVWGSAGDDVYVASYDYLLHFDGTDWEEIDIPAGRVTGSARDDVYAVARDDVWHFDGVAWSEILSNMGLDPLWAGPGSRAVGVSHVGSVDTLRWWDGSSWTVSPAPGFVRAIWGESADDLVAVGIRSGEAAAWTWDGIAWTAAVLPGGAGGLIAVDGAGRDDVIAVGWDGTALHFDGTTWATLDLGTRYWLGDVWVSDTGVAYVTGSDGTVLSRDAAGGWKSAFGDRPAGDGPLWVESPASVRLGKGLGGMSRLEGGTWTEEWIGVYGRVDAIAGRRADDVYAAVRGEGLYRFDGLAWSEVLDSVRYVTDIHALRGGRVCVLDESDGLFVFDGASWRHASPQIGRAVWAAALDDVWIVAPGELVHYDGITTRRAYRGFVWDVWGRATNDVYAVGDGIRHFDGTAWRAVGPRGHYNEVIGDGERVVATGGDTAVFEGGYWRHVTAPKRPVVDLVAGLDGRIYGLTSTRDHRAFFIERLGE